MLNRKIFFSLASIAIAFVIGMLVFGNSVGLVNANNGVVVGQPPVPRANPDSSGLIGPIDVSPPPPENKAPEGYAIQPLRVEDASDFIAHGGRAAIEITPNIDKEGAISKISIQRGSSITIPMKAMYLAGVDPLDSVTITGVGVSNGYIPAFVANKSNEEQRAKEFQETGKISGALDLASTVTATPVKLTLKPNETKELYLTLTIPQDWPEEVIGENIWYSIQFGIAELPDISFKEFQMNQVPIEVTVTG